MKNFRNSKEIKLTVATPHKSCKHGIDNAHCQAAVLDDEDIRAFFDIVYEKSNCEDQNTVLMGYMVPYEPPRRTSKKDVPRKRTSIQYLVRNKSGELVNVCAQTFCSIVAIDRKRLNRVCEYFLKAGKPRKERRGDSRVKKSKSLAKQSIMEFLSNLQPTESHYNRGKSCRFYLSQLLNVHRLWIMWSTKYKNEYPDGDTISYEYFHYIFSHEFNLVFGSPRTDVCSTCVDFENKVKVGGDSGEAAVLQLKLHKLESKHFTRIYNEEADECSTFIIYFDIQQNLLLPKTNIGEVFYKRQIWLYNLGIVCSKFSISYKDIHLYTWTECEAAKCDNEVVSILMNFLTNVSNERAFQHKKYQTLSLFSDSCPAQNKNYSMIMALLMYVNSSQCPFRKIKFTFPVRGHSYMAPDRVFGRIEKDVRKNEVLLLPSDYYAILEAHGTLHKYSASWKAYNYKMILDTSLKKNVLPIQKSKRWMFKKGYTLVWCAMDYIGSFTRFEVLKGNLTLASLKAPLLPTKSCINESKKKDVERF